MINFRIFVKKAPVLTKGSFSALSSREKKRIIQRATEGAVKMQQDLLRKYDKLRSA